MSAQSKAWIKAEQSLGTKAALRPAGLGAAQILASIAQIYCAAQLLAAVLLPELRHWGPIILDVSGYAIFAFARAGLAHQTALAGFEAGASARRRLRGNILLSLFAIGPGAHALLQRRHSADLASLAIDRVEAMDGFHARWIPATILAMLGPVLTGLAVFSVDWRAGVILALAGLFVPFAMAVAGIGAAVAAKRQFSAMTRLQIRFLDRIRGISTIVLAGRAGDEAVALEAAADELRRRTMRVLRVAFLSSTALDLATAAALVFIVIHFAGLASRHVAVAFPALFVLLLVPEFFEPLRNFAAVYQDRMSVEAVAEDLCDLPGPPAPAPALEIRTVAAHGITLGFEDVTFAWDSARGNVIEHLSFRILAGDTLLLTGASGAGKSTIIDLILGFIEPEAGQITFNGAELKSLVPAAREKLIGWIGQKPMIFNGTIRENILFAKPEAGADEVNDAVKRARLTEVAAALPLGLDTPIGEAGFGLSGGQAQRIVIARAFLKDAPLLLLDEPTAHLDPAIERDVLESIRRLAIGRTVILATHSTLAQEFARDTGARRLDLDAARLARLRGVA
jgi:ATP-binding cassette subfamily C protein CydD